MLLLLQNIVISDNVVRGGEIRDARSLGLVARQVARGGLTAQQSAKQLILSSIIVDSLFRGSHAVKDFI